MTDIVHLLQRQDAAAARFSPIEAYADRLHTVVQDLLRQRSVSVSPLCNLARDILLDVREAPNLETIFPESGRSPADQPISPERPADSCVYMAGIQTARLIAWTASHWQAWLDRRELLTIAALLQDVGLLPTKSAHPMTPRQLRTHRPELLLGHPELGAAVAGSITGYAVDLPRLIAEHHERLDGTGYPRQLRSRRLSAPSRFLAIAVRFMELQDDSPQQDGACSNRPQHLTTVVKAAVPYQPVAEMLFREAARGDWDLTLTIGFLESLGFCAGDEQMFPEESPHRMGLSRFGRARLRAEPGHGVIPQPHFGFVRRTAIELPLGERQRRQS